MSEAETQLAKDRGLRSAARGLFDTRLAQVKQDLSARSVPQRVKAKAQDEAVKAIDLGLDVARESKGLIAATLGALALWFFREKLVAAAHDLFGKAGVQEDEANGEAEPNEEHQA